MESEKLIKNSQHWSGELGVKSVLILKGCPNIFGHDCKISKDGYPVGNLLNKLTSASD